MKRLKFSKEKCIGCQLWAQVCSAMKEGVYCPSKARIDIETYYDDGNIKYKDSFFILCAMCVKECPIQCIKMGEYITDDHIKCMGCSACAAKCPKKVIKIRDEK